MEEKSPNKFIEEIVRANKGRLKLYIGGAPGVGKTYKMLLDANEMRQRGIDVIAGFLETYKRKDTEAQIGSLEILPLVEINYKGVILKEMDIKGIINRRPQVVIIDELAHTNVPGSANSKRYEDVLEILDNGISVMTALNIQHLESLNDNVSRMTGLKVRETIPDRMMEIADEVEVIDVSPDTLRERIKNGKIYSEDKIDTALNNFFRVGNLTALRELTLREVAREVDDKLMEYKKKESVDALVGAHEKILVCVELGQNTEYLIRRGYRVAKLLRADLYVLYVKSRHDVADVSKLKILNEVTEICSKLDAKFHIVYSEDKTKPIIEFSKEKGITQIIIGESARTRFHEIFKGSIVRRIMRDIKYADVMVVSDPK